jgi:polar amino acid transport system substrate-binding protein
MREKTSWPWVMILWLSLLTPTGAKAADTVILTADHWCPHTCDPESGRSGYMIDIAREAFALAGLKTQYQIRPWASGLSEIRAGLADGIVGTLPGEAPDLPRNQRALGQQSNAFAVRADDPFTFIDMTSLVGRRIGTVKDYSYSTDIDGWLAQHPQQVLAQAGNRAAETNLGRLLDRQVDLVLDDEAVLRDAIIRTGRTGKVRTAGRLAGGSLHISFSLARHRANSLADTLDNGIVALRRDGRLAAILAGYGLADWE